MSASHSSASDSGGPAILPQPPDELKANSQRLTELLSSRIAANGPLSIAEYMESALFEPGIGYYSAGLSKLGSGGDFTTAPELGDVFARCLVHAMQPVIPQLDGGFSILEIGAGSGRLARDILTALTAAPPVQYLILERSADLRQRQQQQLSQLPGALRKRVVWLDQPPAGMRGVILANEVADALPVERFQIRSGTVLQQVVDVSNDGLVTAFRPAPKALENAVQALLQRLPDGLPDGYCSEINPWLGAWLESIVGGLECGAVLLADYGYPEREYYSPRRNSGTLRCFYRHRMHENPLLWPGLQDITASVNFTELARAGAASGLEFSGYTSQAGFLLDAGLEQVLSGMETLPEQQRLALSEQVKRLTLPGEMGERYQLLSFKRNLQVPLAGFTGLDLSYRL